MKRQLGVSVYPEQSTFEKDKEYLDMAKNMGYDVVFTSVLHFVGTPNQKESADKVIRVLQYAKSIGFYTILDVEYASMEMIGISVNDVSKCVEYGVDCLRLDSPSLPKEIADVTHNKYGIDVQINMSNNDNLITNVLDFKPVLSRLTGMHNFYPLEDTALPFDFFMECNKKFIKNRLKTAAFIGSHIGNMTTATGWTELPTIEEQRFLSVEAQAKLLFYTNEIDLVLFGNAYASKEELQAVANIDRYEITFDLKCEPEVTDLEKRILTEMDHFRRGDITEIFVRSTMSRVVFKKDSIEPRDTKKTFNYGDVVIVNNNDVKYKGEVHIILKEGYENKNNKYNYIGTVGKEEKRLISFVEPWSHFRFNLK